ncbi:MAG: phosphoribosylglycinamide formyltransferase [Acidimicrobiia bacterium]|nr:phosphoribosylglycinamide formyltransferase [Acidimicrobiia bacterium]
MDFVVLASGSGSNLQAIIDADNPTTRVVGVITDRPGVRALGRAEAARIPTRVVDWKEFRNREPFTTRICDTIEELGGEAVVMAGFMRILGPEAIQRFPERILNIHPSLLPAFPGAHAVADALAYGATMTGVTVHIVDEEVDHGPIISQVAVPVLDGDDEETLHGRIQKEEHDLFPRVIEEFACGALKVDGRRVRRS